EILALIVADMHRDFRAWETVWLRVDPNQPPSDVSPVSVEMDFEQADDVTSMSETSKVKSSPNINSLVLSEPQIVVEGVAEDETWDAMLKYTRTQCEKEGKQNEGIESASMNVVQGTD